MIECDVTGGLIEEVWQKAGKFSYFRKLRSLEDIEIPEFKTGTDPGMVISLNIFTQLESLIVSYIKKEIKFKGRRSHKVPDRNSEKAYQISDEAQISPYFRL